MIIKLDTEDHALDGVLRYTDSEHSFRFDVGSPADLKRRVGADGTTSIAIDTLQIEVGVATRRALFVWGLHPRSRWVMDHLDPPAAKEGEVFVDPHQALLAGVTVMAAPEGSWLTKYDPETGWIRVEADTQVDDAEVEIARSVVLGGKNGVLHSIWLQPVFE